MDQEPNTPPNPTPGAQFTPPVGSPQPPQSPSPLPPQPQPELPPQPPQPQQPFGMPTPPPQPQFQPQPPQPNGKKKLLVIIGIIVAVLIIGAVLYLVLGKKKDDTNTGKTTNTSANTSSNSGNATTGGTTTPDKFTKYDVKDVSGIEYSVLFYKDAKPLAKNSLTYLIAGDSGAQSSVYLAPSSAPGTQADCASAGLTPTTMKINSQQTVVCYASGNVVYMGFTSVNGKTIRVNVAAQKGISMDDAKTILESITFK